MDKVFKIDGVPQNVHTMAFGRSIEYLKIIRQFKEKAKSVWVGAKGRSCKQAFLEWKRHNKPKQFFASWNDSSLCKDDAFEVFYI